MAKAPVQSHTQTVPAYPSCEECVAWSEAGIAIAGAENVYFASDRGAYSEQDRIDVLRVDHFDREEWPDAPMVTLSDLSFGEEQSESIVAALAWSPPGLGIHRRCVLAVLTSNLVLSIWETDGSRNSWRRTCVINNSISNHTVNGSGKKAHKANRVRAFVWLPALKQNDGDRWGIHLLLTADDENNIILWTVKKQEQQKYGSWLVESTGRGGIPDGIALRDITSMTSLQVSLIRGRKVERFIVDTWQEIEGQFTLKVEAIFNNSPNLNQSVSIGVQVIVQEDKPSAQLTFGQQDQDDSGMQAKDHSEWEQELESICADYRRKFQLRRLRIRFWGFADSPDHTRRATVVTLHARDSYEYTTANTEKSWLVMKQLGAVAARSSEKDLLVVRKSVLDHILRALQNGYEHYELDTTLLTVWSAYAELHGLDDVHSALNSYLGRNDANVRAPDAQTGHAKETCNICQSPLSMNAGALDAICQSGHPFPRCTLSLLAIQEPRISKSCSRCQRQFLDLTKLGPLPHRTLMADVFDEFDTCPVCDGKYQS